jgi:SAM-dependent methyltransferase
VEPIEINDRSSTQAHCWDRVAWEKTFTHPVGGEWLETRVARSEHILDLGCGYGRAAPVLRAHGYTRLVGIDVSGEMLRRARREQPDLGLVRVGSPPYPFADGSFGAVLLLASLGCVPADEDQRAIMGEVGRLLRPGGLMCLSDYLLQDDDRNRERYQRCRPPSSAYGTFELPEGAVVRHHDLAWIEMLTRPFERIAFDEIEVVTMNGHQARAFRFVGARVSRST